MPTADIHNHHSTIPNLHSILTMHFSTIILSLASFTTLASSCLTFDGTLSTQIPRKITGKLTDNGSTICTIDEYVDQEAATTAWAKFDCNKGYTAWIQTVRDPFYNPLPYISSSIPSHVPTYSLRNSLPLPSCSSNPLQLKITRGLTSNTNTGRQPHWLLERRTQP